MAGTSTKREQPVPFEEVSAYGRDRDGGRAEPRNGLSMTGRRHRTVRVAVILEETSEEEWCCDVRRSER